jgi:hypothetical protein
MANPPPSPAPSLTDDLKQIGQVAGVVSTLLTVLSLGLPAMLAWVTEYLGPAIPMWKAFIATAPLTLSVAVLGVGMLRGWLDDIVSLALWSTGTFIVTGGIGHLLGLGGWVDIGALWNQKGGNPLEFAFVICLAFIENYWKMYGAQMFCSSLLVGGFLAWAWGVKLMPHLEQLPEQWLNDVSDESPRKAA